MIQRIQSIFILVAILLMCSLIAWPIDSFASAKGIMELRWNGFWNVTPGCQDPMVRSLTPLAIVLLVAVILNVVGLFMFKHRPLQMRMVGIAAGIEVCVTALFIYLCVTAADAMGSEFHFCLGWLTPLLAAVLDYLAYRRISDDEALVKSLDRLR